MARGRLSGEADHAARTVLLVEDDALLRDLVSRELARQGFNVETAANATEAKRAIDAGDHDALILDINLGPGPTGFDLADTIRKSSPHVGIVFLTDVPDARFVGRGIGDLPAGVAYLRKSALEDLDTLVMAIDQVLRGESSSALRADKSPDRPLAHLTRVQLSVARLIAQGLSNAQIAEARNVSVKSVEEVITRTALALKVDASNEGSVRVAIARRYLAAAHGGVFGANDVEQP